MFNKVGNFFKRLGGGVASLVDPETGPYNLGRLYGSLNPTGEPSQARAFETQRQGLIQKRLVSNNVQQAQINPPVQPASIGTQNTGATGTPSPTGTPTTGGLPAGGSGISNILNQFKDISTEDRQLLGLEESPEQKTQREALTNSLNRLITLKEELTKANAPRSNIASLDQMIAEQDKALTDLTPESFLKTQRGLQDVGITQSQLQREVAARRDPIASGLANLLFSRSILAQQQQQDIERVQGQIAGVGEEMELRQAISALSPKKALPEKVQELAFGEIFKSPFEKQKEGLEIDKLQAQIAKLRGIGVSGLSADQRKQFDKISRVELSANQIENLVGEIQKNRASGFGPLARIGGVGSQIAAFTGLNPEVASYNDFRQAMISPLARAISGEVGTLTDKDIARAEGLLPRVTDTDEEIRRKLINLRQAINDGYGAIGATSEGLSQSNAGLEELFAEAME